jgi:hypothetical protein
MIVRPRNSGVKAEAAHSDIGDSYFNISKSSSVNIDSISIEAGNRTFEMTHGYLIDILFHKLIYSFSGSSNITIPHSLEILGSSCLSQFTNFHQLHWNPIQD